jgi:hypothetical protein
VTSNKLDPVHPGEVLREEFLKPMALSQNQLALSLGVQSDYDLDVASDELGERLDREVRVRALAG